MPAPASRNGAQRTWVEPGRWASPAGWGSIPGQGTQAPPAAAHRRKGKDPGVCFRVTEVSTANSERSGLQGGLEQGRPTRTSLFTISAFFPQTQP